MRCEKREYGFCQKFVSRQHLNRKRMTEKEEEDDDDEKIKRLRIKLTPVYETDDKELGNRRGKFLSNFMLL